MSTTAESTSIASNRLVIAVLDGHKFALPLSAVERIVRAVEVTPVPNAPEMVLGVVNVQGEIVPVIDLRRRFGLPGRDMELSDHLIIARASDLAVALLVDEVSDVREYGAQQVVGVQGMLSNMKDVEGVIKLEGELVLIHSLKNLLTVEEEEMLSGVVNQPQTIIKE